jgi:multicomponent Na+:H+ antiporter subunit D
MTADLAAIGMILTPLVAALAVFLAAPRRAAPAIAAAAGLAQAYLLVVLTRGILREGPLRYRLGGWDAPLGVNLYVDGVASLMLGMTVLVGLAVTIYASGYFSTTGDDHPGPPASGAPVVPAENFWPLWLFLWSALNALFLSADIFNVYITLELTTLAAVALIGLAGQATALAAAFRYLIFALIGSLFYLLGVALMYSAYGAVDFELLGSLVRDDGVTKLAAVLLIVGLMLKTALFPLHFWLAPAHAHAPAPASALLSGLVLKASFFVILRLWFTVLGPMATPPAGRLLSTLGAAAILWGSIQAIRQPRVKMMIAYSTVAQIGYLFLIFSLAEGASAALAWRGTAYFALAHACAKAAAFMSAGTLMHCAGTDELSRWRGIARCEPVPMFAFALAGVSLMGLPPSGGFIAKWLLLNAAIAADEWLLAAVLLAGGLLAAVYVFRVAASSFVEGEPPPETRRAPWTMRWTPLALALAAIVFGVVTTEPIQILDVGSPLAAPLEPTPPKLMP